MENRCDSQWHQGHQMGQEGQEEKGWDQDSKKPPPVTDHREQVPVRTCGEQGENDAETSSVEAKGSESWGLGAVVPGGRGHQQHKGRMAVELTHKKVPVS